METVWDWKTPSHWQEKLWFFGGILMIIITMFLKSSHMIMDLFMITICILAIAPCIYSYVLYRKITQNV